MKSLLEEAASIPKAIDKAWQAAGKPSEFTVKVFQTEERSFLGMLRRPAVVSIVYDPRRQGKGAGRDQAGYVSAPKVSAGRGNVSVQVTTRRSAPPEQPSKGRPTSQQRPERGTGQGAARPRNDSYPRNNSESWSSEEMMDVTRWLKELLAIMNSKVKFAVDTERGLLKIEFEEPVIEAPEFERMLFVSFASLLMQFLKRKYKQKFRGYRITLRSRR